MHKIHQQDFPEDNTWWCYSQKQCNIRKIVKRWVSLPNHSIASASREGNVLHRAPGVPDYRRPYHKKAFTSALYSETLTAILRKMINTLRMLIILCLVLTSQLESIYNKYWCFKLKFNLPTNLLFPLVKKKTYKNVQFQTLLHLPYSHAATVMARMEQFVWP